MPNTKKTPAIQASEPRLQVQARTVDMPKLPVMAPQQPAPPPKVMPTSPSFAAEVRPELPAPKAVVVVNAVTIPPGPLPAVPEAELTSRFVIAPPTAPIATETASGTVSGATDVRAAVSSSGSLPKTPTPSVPNDGAAARPGDTALPGLVISGGVRGRGGRTDNSAPIAGPSYGLTIISGGNSGGASRNVGVFSRNDTVYTVYIPMSDAGGGTPWSMEYALLGTAPANSGLLAPPVVLKKAPVTASVTDIGANSGPVFLTGVIDESGNLRDLRAIHASDPRAHSAMDALAQWEFQAAELDGKPVASKVLIGVSVSRPQETRKENQ